MMAVVVATIPKTQWMGSRACDPAVAHAYALACVCFVLGDYKQNTVVSWSMYAVRCVWVAVVLVALLVMVCAVCVVFQKRAQLARWELGARMWTEPTSSRMPHKSLGSCTTRHSLSCL